ncbi:carbohydrate ABC transporter permease [Paenibacillus qinlingensis]|uniref:Multiple sugar transport system permease protein n=1 Tax=Paenibacillus qinlingensis TaxID=1837343 RepID=A0ABU1NP75_9BACL|nr:carbohydrate ABC transporter permease [Paenibacillus qinlingensis]MDR6548826.1 multiple sugar transport system permease protein [Paenibacillus qinlingensis]
METTIVSTPSTRQVAIANMRKGSFWLKIFVTLILGAISIVMILPFLWMVSTSFKINGDVFKYPIDWIPNTWHFENYKKVWAGADPFYLFYWNSIKITGITVVGNLLTSSMAGYAFAKIRFKGRNFLFLLYLSTMMIPGQVLLVPRFILFDQLQLINTHAAIILPGLFWVFGTFLMRQFFTTLPGELLESARVDGASYWRTFWQICLPLTKPALVTLLILSFTWHWNEYENPLIMLREKALYTIPLGLTSYVEEFGTNYVLTMAASVSGLVPLLIVVAVCQKWFVEGITSSGLKG